MPDLTGYTSEHLLNPFAHAFIEAAETAGFRVFTTPRVTYGKRETLWVTWRGKYVALMHHKLWARKRDPFVCIYRFDVAKVPDDFDLDRFARERGIESAQIDLKVEKDGSYLRVRDMATAIRLLQAQARIEDARLFTESPRDSAQEIAKDIQQILADPSLSQTEAMAWVAVRLRQGAFRAALDREFDSTCPVTGSRLREVLRASHIVPWSEASPEERVDPKNGLLLAANVDALFDRYMITFLPDGAMQVSDFLRGHELEKLGSLRDLDFSPCLERAAFLARHNDCFAREESRRKEYVELGRFQLQASDLVELAD